MANVLEMIFGMEKEALDILESKAGCYVVVFRVNK